ncbi:MAG: tRNA glutamyl-Q(34) synthetase GluQRS [Phycisphaeraceae bacterium]|nr:tRNA glutamyl-Q(34) synthetase GluQRS [Phycisphaerae bacterium]MBX3393322.1 tRNA glutamyl-Q(34) synthetase GluQRS [Phycisphaeraceae bacterium]
MEQPASRASHPAASRREPPGEVPTPGHTTRLAPSPTGALHLGNARTFLINWSLARRQNWKIILRIEDLDGPRIKPGAVDLTVDLLRWLGLDWDEGPMVQSRDLDPYRQAMRRLAAQGLVYPCELTRAEIEGAAGAPQEGSGETVFPASMRPAVVASRSFDDEHTNWRFVVDEGSVKFTDRFAGLRIIEPARSIGDFVVWTRRGIPAYQLAVVVDDHRQGVTQVVRGNDLLDSAARQILLYRALGLGPIPTYTHLPLVRGVDGRRLAKRHGDTRLDSYRRMGVPPGRILTLLARWCGVETMSGTIDATEFSRRFDLTTMSPGDVVFRVEDEQWLRLPV